MIKEKESSKILTAAWSLNGSSLAVGMQSGVISIRNEEGVECQRIERRGPVFTLLFLPDVHSAHRSTQMGPNVSSDAETLVVGTWDKILSVHQ